MKQHQIPTALAPKPDEPLKKRRHKKRAKKRRKNHASQLELPLQLPAPLDLNSSNNAPVVQDRKHKRRRRRQKSSSLLVESVPTQLDKKVTKPAVSLPADSLQLPLPILPSHLKAMRSPLVKAEPTLRAMLTTNTAAAQLLTPQMSPAPPPEKALSLKQLFKSTGDVTQTPLELLEDFLVNPMFPLEPL